MAKVASAKELTVYRKAYELAMLCYRTTLSFPAEERFALTSQLRRSSRSVCMNLQEAWAKRRYPAHFLSKLTDCDGENSETETSIDFARSCGYITPQHHSELVELNKEIGRMLGSMIRSPEKFTSISHRSRPEATPTAFASGSATGLWQLASGL